MPESVSKLGMEHVYFGRPAKKLLAVYPLVCLKGPVLGLQATPAEDPPFFLFTAQYLSRSNWAPIPKPVSVGGDQAWGLLSGIADFEEEDSDLSSFADEWD